MSELVSLSTTPGGVATVTLGAPGKVFVVNSETAEALRDALTRVAAMPEARVLVLASGGSSFCGGGDIRQIQSALADPDALLGPLIEKFHECILAMRRLALPVLGSVRGAAAGGGFSLAMACDLLVAAETARFVAGYPVLGTSSDGGLSHFLTRRAGGMKALEIMFVAETLSAAQMQALGLVAQVADDAALDAQTQALADKLAAAAPQSLREFKKLIGAAEDAELPAQLEREKAAFLRCAKTADFRGRVEAFLARRR